MNYELIETGRVGARGESSNADRIGVGHVAIGVVDGATAKSWDDPSAPRGSDIADAVAYLIETMTPSCEATEFVKNASSTVAHMHEICGVQPGSGSAATFALVHSFRREAWRVGDAHIAIDGKQVEELETGELAVAHARALVVQHALATGTTVRELQDHDAGREAIQPLLRALVGLRNVTVPGGYGAIDGLPVPECFIEVIPLPETRCEVILTTDGYPSVGVDLQQTEALLRTRLDLDPLLIAEPPATKGCVRDAVSFDDRAFVRLVLPLGDRD